MLSDHFVVRLLQDSHSYCKDLHFFRDLSRICHRAGYEKVLLFSILTDFYNHLTPKFKLFQVIMSSRAEQGGGKHGAYGSDITKIVGHGKVKTSARCHICKKNLADSCAKAVTAHRRYRLRECFFLKWKVFRHRNNYFRG